MHYGKSENDGSAHATGEAVRGVLPAPRPTQVSASLYLHPLCWVRVLLVPPLAALLPAHGSTSVPSCHVCVWFCSVLRTWWAAAEVSPGNVQSIGIPGADCVV